MCSSIVARPSLLEQAPMTDNITIFPSARMTEADYDRVRAELGDRKDAKARWDRGRSLIGG